jgi:hypothetical protein
VVGGIEVAKDDRATEQSLIDFLFESGSGGTGKDVDGNSRSPVAIDGKSDRRKLRATFRPIPLSTAFPDGDKGFPGTKSFTPRRSDRGKAGATVQPAAAGDDRAPAGAPSPDNPARRGAAVLEAGPAVAAAVGPAVPAAEGGAGGRVRGRPPGRKGTGKQDEAAGLPKAIAKLIPPTDNAAAPRVLVPTESERQDARRLFREIGERFNVNRKRSKTAAYAAYRHDLMANLDTLIMGGAIDLKEVTTVITNLEQYTKETEAESTETPATILGKWLRMDAAEVAGLEVAAVEEEESGEEVDELDAAADPAHAGDSH